MNGMDASQRKKGIRISAATKPPPSGRRPARCTRPGAPPATSPARSSFPVPIISLSCATWPIPRRRSSPPSPRSPPRAADPPRRAMIEINAPPAVPCRLSGLMLSGNVQ